MGFDDLARHMASRDGKKPPPLQAGNADQIMAEAAEADRWLSRKRDLILGPVLLVGGLIILTFIGLYLADVYDPAPSPERPPSENGILIPIGGTITAGGMVIAGVLQTIRGIRGRSH